MGDGRSPAGPRRAREPDPHQGGSGPGTTRLAALVDRASELLAIVDANVRVVFASRSLIALLGYQPADLIGRSAYELVHPEDLPKVLDLVARARASGVATGSAAATQHLRLRYAHRDGSWRTLDTWTTNLLHDPAVAGVVIAARDVTEEHLAEGILAEREAALRLIVGQLPAALWTTDRALNPTSMMGAALPLFEADGRGSELGRAALAGESISTVLELHDRVYDIHVQPRRNASGAIEGTIGIALDVTERAHAEAAVRERDEELRRTQALDALGRLASGLAHDFNNLLTTVTTNAHLLLASLPADDPDRDEAEAITRAAGSASALVAQLLAFGQRQILEPSTVDLNELVRQVEPMVRALLPARIRIETALRSSAAWVTVDRGQIERVLVNLAVNAADAMPEGGTLTIATKGVARGGSGASPGTPVELSVADTGVGMDPEVRRRAFEPFFTTKAPGRGTGLGLSTVLGIVEQSGGAVAVESQPGRGTIVRVSLPAARSASSQRADSIVPGPSNATAPTPARRQAPAPARGATILLAEDDGDIRVAIGKSLRRLGHKVLDAVDGRQALEVAAAHPGPIDLLVADVVMPRLGGAGLARRLVRARGDLPVLLLSGEPSRRAGLDPRPGPLLRKPFTPEALAAAVSAALAGPPAAPASGADRSDPD